MAFKEGIIKGFCGQRKELRMYIELHWKVRNQQIYSALLMYIIVMV